MEDRDELQQVIVGTCGCLLPTDTKPAGYRFVATPTGDRRVAVYACDEHNRLRAVVESDQPLTKKPKPKRAAKSK